MLDCLLQEEVELIQKLNAALEGNNLKQKKLILKNGSHLQLGAWVGLGAGKVINHTDLLESERFQEVC